MHRPARSRTERGSLRWLWLSHSRTALEDWLTTNRHSAAGTLSRLRRTLGAQRRRRTSWRRRSCVNRTRSCLRRNHAAYRRSRCLRALLLRRIRDRACRRGWRNWSRWRRNLNRGRRLRWGRRSCCRRGRRRRCWLLGRRHLVSGSGRSGGRCSKRRTNRNDGLDNSLRRRLGRRRNRSSHNFLRRRRSRSRGLGNRGGRHCDLRLDHCRGRRLRFAAQQIRNVAGFGNMREIDLGFDLTLSSSRSATVSRRARCALPGKKLADTFGFVDFDRTRVRLLFRYPDFGKDIKDSFALDFQLPRQIVDSNFTHPPVFSPKNPVRRSSQPSRNVCLGPKPAFLFVPKRRSLNDATYSRRSDSSASSGCGSSGDTSCRASETGSSPCTCTSAASAVGAFSTPAISAASRACPVS